jgi:hypothetical protein
MKLVDTDETVVLVTGSGIPAEERDRPLAYWLKQEIDRRGAGHPYRRAVVVGDVWYLENRIFHLNPTVAIGGPGANGLTAELAGQLPGLWTLEDRAFVQGDFESDPKRAALWGMDLSATSRAVEAFMQRGYLDRLLAKIWRWRTEVFV